MRTMKAVVFKEKSRIALEEVPKPTPKWGEAVIRITATTICGTDVHIVRGEYPVRPGSDPRPRARRDHRGARRRPGERVRGRTAGDRRRHHAVWPVLLLPQRHPLAVRRRPGRLALRQHDQRRVGGVPAGSGRTRQPRADSRRRCRTRKCCCCPDIFSTGLSGAESGNIRVGDAVAIFAQGRSGSAPRPARS